jgi:hypothetical protein
VLIGFDAFDKFLAERQIFLLFMSPFHLKLIGLFVRLGSRTVHRRAFATVEHPELNAGCIDDPAHLAAQSVNFPDDLTFCDPSNRRIAAHLANAVAVHCQQRRPGSQSGTGQGSFRSCMAGTHNDNIKSIKVCGAHVLNAGVGKGGRSA